MSDLILDSLRRRIAIDALVVGGRRRTMTVDQVNYVERAPVLPIAFSLFHFAQIEDGAASMLGAGPLVYTPEWARGSVWPSKTTARNGRWPR